MKNVSPSHAWRIILFSHIEISTSIIFFFTGFRFIVGQQQSVDLMTGKQSWKSFPN